MGTAYQTWLQIPNDTKLLNPLTKAGQRKTKQIKKLLVSKRWRDFTYLSCCHFHILENRFIKLNELHNLNKLRL